MAAREPGVLGASGASRRGLGSPGVRGLPPTFALPRRPRGSNCSYQLGAGGSFWIMPALGPSQNDFIRRVAWADGLVAEPDARLGGPLRVVRPSLDHAERL